MKNLSFDSQPRLLIVTLIVGLTFLFTSRADALGFAESVESMIARADLIFIGTLKEIRSFKDTYVDHPYGGEHIDEAVEMTAIFTESVFNIDEVLKGNFPDKEIAIRQSGGLDGDVVVRPPTAYQPFLERQYIVIAVKAQLFNGAFVTVSGGQGILEKYEHNGITYLRNLNNDTLVKKGDDPNTQIDLDVTLNIFLKMVGDTKK